jgi:hypothetical protein
MTEINQTQCTCVQNHKPAGCIIGTFANTTTWLATGTRAEKHGNKKYGKQPALREIVASGPWSGTKHSYFSDLMAMGIHGEV